MSEFRHAGRAAAWLSLAAAPAFAIMALLTATYGGGPADILCSAAHDGSPLSGMTLMYALMSVFHSTSWLKLISRRQTTRVSDAKAVGASPLGSL